MRFWNKFAPSWPPRRPCAGLAGCASTPFPTKDQAVKARSAYVSVLLSAPRRPDHFQPGQYGLPAMRAPVKSLLTAVPHARASATQSRWTPPPSPIRQIRRIQQSQDNCPACWDG